jgi:hypothetical protein
LAEGIYTIGTISGNNFDDLGMVSIYFFESLKSECFDENNTLLFQSDGP